MRTFWLGKDTRDKIFSLYPGLKKDEKYRRFFQYLLHGTFKDELTGDLVLAESVLGPILRVEHQTKHGNFSIRDFLEAFQRDVVKDFEFGGWRFITKEARTALHLGLDDEIEELIYDEVRRIAHGENIEIVDFVSGRRRSDRRNKLEHDKMIAHIEAKLPDAPPLTQRIIRYQNGLSPRGFTEAVTEGKLEAFNYINSMKDINKKRAATRHLEQVLKYPKPILQPAQNSARAFSVGLSMSSIKREVRACFTRSWTSVDLKSAHLAAVAKAWDIPEVHEFLSAGNSIWTYLQEALSVSSSFKPALKMAIYSLAFGASKPTVIEPLQALPNPPSEDDFFNIPFIKQVYDARNKRLRSIIDTGWADIGFNRIVKIEVPKTKDEDYWKKLEKQARSALALQAQSLEIQLISPVYDVLQDSESKIMLYLFDGLKIRFDSALKSSRRKLQNKMIDAVQEKADELEIPTSLEIDNE